MTNVMSTFSSILSNAGFLLAVVFSLYLYSNVELVQKFCQKFYGNSFLKPIFEYINDHVKQFCGFLLATVASFGALPNRYSFVVVVLAGAIIFSLPEAAYLEYLLLTIFVLLFFRVRSLKSRIVVIILALITIALGWWGALFTTATVSNSAG